MRNATEAERELANSAVCSAAVAVSGFTATQRLYFTLCGENHASALCTEKWRSGKFHMLHDAPLSWKVNAMLLLDIYSEGVATHNWHITCFVCFFYLALIEFRQISGEIKR